MSRILGIDYGASRTGVAITDELEITAQGLETITSNGNDKILLKRLEEIINEYNVSQIVIGNPINMDGSISKRSEETDIFIHKLHSRFNQIPIIKVDERLTTVESYRTMNFLNIKGKKQKEIVDTIAAVFILENYINRKK